MADPRYPPGSRAIKIPISKLKTETTATSGQRQHNHDMLRTGSTESSSSSSEAAGSASYKSDALSAKRAGPSESVKKPETIKFSPSLSPSMLSSSSYKSINLNSHLNGPDTPPRLICYTKHSQGFTWNDELFLPSYMVGKRYRKNRRWDDDDDDDDPMFDEEADRCPVMDIFVTDEEAKEMFP